MTHDFSPFSNYLSALKSTASFTVLQGKVEGGVGFPVIILTWHLYLEFPLLSSLRFGTERSLGAVAVAVWAVMVLLVVPRMEETGRLRGP